MILWSNRSFSVEIYNICLFWALYKPIHIAADDSWVTSLMLSGRKIVEALFLIHL